MTIAQTMLAEFDAESRTTRKFLERLPDDKLDWRPHPKSMTAGELALHIATTPGGVIRLSREDEVAAPEFGRPNPRPASTREVLAALDESIAAVHDILPTFGDERMQVLWKMKLDGKELLAVPRAAFLRNVLLNHWYHHRGQFGVYLRLLGAKVPSSYGPSGDEMPDFLAK
ncbi:MAG TPA: DinB family protein [Pirellulales bacterium]|nr:DinB family protein [Pirellulales bacterium]